MMYIRSYRLTVVNKELLIYWLIISLSYRWQNVCLWRVIILKML